MKQQTTWLYKSVILQKNKIPKCYRVHRLVGKAFVDNPNGKPCINHKNGIKTDNRFENLEWVTHSENNLHSFKNGLQKPTVVHLKGELNGEAKLNESQVRVIRWIRYVDPGISAMKIANYFNMSEAQILRILNKQSWKHVEIYV